MIIYHYVHAKKKFYNHRLARYVVPECFNDDNASQQKVTFWRCAAK